MEPILATICSRPSLTSLNAMAYHGSASKSCGTMKNGSFDTQIAERRAETEPKPDLKSILSPNEAQEIDSGLTTVGQLVRPELKDLEGST